MDKTQIGELRQGLDHTMPKTSDPDQVFIRECILEGLVELGRWLRGEKECEWSRKSL